MKPFPKQALVFTYLQYKSFENTAGKGEIAPNEQFLLFLQCFLRIWRTFCHFHQIQNWHLHALDLEESKKPSFGKGLNTSKKQASENIAGKAAKMISNFSTCPKLSEILVSNLSTANFSNHYKYFQPFPK